jgi:hypothetical protein
MSKALVKLLESEFTQAQGNLQVNLSKRGSRVTSRQIAKVFTKALPLREIIRSERKPKLGKEIVIDDVDQYLSWQLDPLSTVSFSADGFIGECYNTGDVVTKVDVTKHLELSHPKRHKPKPSEFKAMVDWFTQEIDNLPRQAQIALATAYIWASKAPKQEQEDLFQELTLKLIENGTEIEQIAWVVSHADWVDWWRRYKLHSQYCESHLSEIQEIDTDNMLDWAKEDFDKALTSMDWGEETIEECNVAYLLHDTTKQIQHEKQALSDYLSGIAAGISFEDQVIDKLDAKAMLKKIPKAIKALGLKRLAGKPLSSTERMRLKTFKDNHQELIPCQS